MTTFLSDGSFSAFSRMMMTIIFVCLSTTSSSISSTVTVTNSNTLFGQELIRETGRFSL